MATGREALLDLALPEASALVSLEVRDGGRWRVVDPAYPGGAGGARADELYRAESAARGVTPASEPYDESATHRLRVLRSAGHGADPFTVRFRFAVLPRRPAGGCASAFPPRTERLPVPAEVVLQARRRGRRRHRRGARPRRLRMRPPSGTPRRAGPGRFPGRRATSARRWRRSRRASRSPWSLPAQAALAFLARRPLGPEAAPPGSVLFLVDRSRSVGLPGLSAERDLVRAVIETLPPSTRFDALFFDRGTKRLFPMSRPATREAIEAFEQEMVPERLQNGTDLPAALHEAGDAAAGARRRASVRTRSWFWSPTVRWATTSTAPRSIARWGRRPRDSTWQSRR